MSDSLHHEVAWGCAAEIVSLFRSVLREEELRDVHAEVYRVLTDWLGRYAARADRMHQRLHPLPSDN